MFRPKAVPSRLDPSSYESLRQQILRRDGWRCQSCGTMSNLEVHHKEFRSHSGADSEENLITRARYATPERIERKATTCARMSGRHDSISARPTTTEPHRSSQVHGQLAVLTRPFLQRWTDRFRARIGLGLPRLCKSRSTLH
jgi:hypothetical protein